MVFVTDCKRFFKRFLADRRLLLAGSLVGLMIGIWLGNTQADWSGLTFWVLFLTLIVLGIYTFFTRELAKQAIASNTFAALSSVHQCLSEHRTCREHILQQTIQDELKRHIRECIPGDFIGYQGGPLTLSLESLQTIAIDNPMCLDEFNHRLRGVALEAIEQTLADFDMIALPLSLGIEAAKKLAEAYKPMLERTAEPLLAFIAVHRQLRGEPKYREPYIQLLKFNRINTFGL